VLPITELYRCQIVPQPLDVPLVQEACRLFIGQWDFRSFMKSGRDTNLKIRSRNEEGDLNKTVFTKTILKFSFSKATIEDDASYFPMYNTDSFHKKFDLYDFTVVGSGFLRRQVCVSSFESVVKQFWNKINHNSSFKLRSIFFVGQTYGRSTFERWKWQN